MKTTQRLSSNATWFYKYAFLPGVPIAFTVLGFEILLFQPVETRWLAVMFFAAGLGLGLWFYPIARKLKGVIIDNEGLVVSGATRITKIPFSSVESVDLGFLSCQPIKVLFWKEDKSIGEIYFIPQGHSNILSDPPPYCLLMTILEQEREAKGESETPKRTTRKP